ESQGIVFNLSGEVKGATTAVSSGTMAITSLSSGTVGQINTIGLANTQGIRIGEILDINNRSFGAFGPVGAAINQIATVQGAEAYYLNAWGLPQMGERQPNLLVSTYTPSGARSHETGFQNPRHYAAKRFARRGHASGWHPLSQYDFHPERDL